MGKTKHQVTWTKEQNRSPKVNEITVGKELDHQGATEQKTKYIFKPCKKCKTPRWVQLGHKDTKLICSTCRIKLLNKQSKERSGSLNPSWKGGRSTSREYILIKLDKSHPFYCMCNKVGYIPEHRLVMANKEKRPLEKHEQVHHLNGNKHDNSEQNLVILTPHEHTWVTRLIQRIKELEKENQELKDERKNTTTSRNIS